MEKLINNIENIWQKIKLGELNKKDVFNLLEKYNNELILFEGKYSEYFLYNVSQMLLRLHSLMNTTINDDNLEITKIILTEKDEVYYVFYKSQIKEFTLELDWFFRLYNKTELVAQNNSFLLVKDKKISILAFLTNIILNKNKEPILSKDDYVWKDFYESIKY